MTKHSDYFVWKDTSECVARRCDYTVNKKRVNSCVPEHLFLEGVEQPKKSPNNPGNTFSDALLMSRFQNFAADAAKKKPRSARFFDTALRAVLINESIRINSGPNILRSCFLHWKNIVTHGALLDELPRNLSTAKCLLPRKPFKSLLVTMLIRDCGSCVAVMACTFEVRCFWSLEVRHVWLLRPENKYKLAHYLYESPYCV